MSLQLLLQPPTGAQSVNSPNLQFLPAKLQSITEEAANVDQFFDLFTSTEVTNATAASSADVLHSALRGYPVRGERFPLPTSHVGVIFAVEEQLAETKPRRCQQIANFSDFVHWNYDQTPSGNDALQMAVNSLNFTEELHKSVDPQELQLFLQSQTKNTNGAHKQPSSGSTEPMEEAN